MRPALEDDSLCASDVMSHHARRDFGRTGFRDVTMQVFNQGTETCRYTICHVWRVADDACSSLLFLTAPQALAGTGVIAIEHPNEEAMQIWLRLRTSAQPIAFEASRSVQHVLGTDFTFEDLRFWLPLRALQIAHASWQRHEGVAACLVRASRSSPHARWPDLRLWLHGTHWLPLSIEWFDESPGGPAKVYSAGRLQQVDGVWTPTVVSVARPAHGYSSRMTMKRAAHRIDVDPALFDPATLNDISAMTFETWRARSTDCADAATPGD